LKNKTKFFLGVDIGSYYTKAVLINENKEIVTREVTESGLSFEETSRKVLENICKKSEIKKEDINKIVSTGVGRENFPYKDFARTEIGCLVKGVFHYFKKECTIIDIGGEDVKVVSMDKDGKEMNFSMNRKCAAGTGAFLEDISRRLKMGINELHSLAEKANESIEINSFCTVFAGTEIIHLIREGKKIENIARGVYESLVSRILSMVRINKNLVMTGGVIHHNPIVADILEKRTGIKPYIPPEPQFIVAFGASLFALENV